MCGVRQIKNEYINNYTNKPVHINGDAEKFIFEKATKVLALYRNGVRYLIFPDVIKIEKTLLEKLVIKE